MHKFTRRALLQGGMKAAVTAGAAGLAATGCSTVAPPWNPTDQRARVVAVRGMDLRAMAREALDAFGGAQAFIAPGETVFIKPNFGGFGMVKYDPVQAGDSCKPELVISVAEECLKAGAGEVIIGEGGQARQFDWAIVKTLDGATNMAEEAQRLRETYSGTVTLACLNADSPEWDTVPSYNKNGAVEISSLVNRADKVISIPVLKTHRWTQITASLKNFVGVTSTDRYGLGIQWRFLLHDAGIEQSFLDIVSAVKPCFTIVDGSICCEGNGPHVLPGYWGTTVDVSERIGAWFVLAGTDLPAVDATAARIIGQDVAGVTHLNMAYGQGLGQINEDQIDLEGAAMADLQMHWQPAQHTEGFLEVIVPGIHLIS